MSRSDSLPFNATNLIDAVPKKSLRHRIVQTSSGLVLHGAQEHRILNLNDCSRYIWDSCNGTATVRQMIDRICTAFDDLSHEQIRDDVLSAIIRLAEAGAIDVSGVTNREQGFSEPEYFYIVDQRPRGGLFSCLNRVLDYCYFCDHHGLVPLVWWGDRGCYWVEGGYRGATNVFEYYFEPMSGISLTQEPDVSHVRWSGHTSFTGYESVVAPRGKNLKNLNFPDRIPGNRVIRKNLRIKPEILDIVDEFVDANFDGYTIGAHIRGPERRDGGSAWMRRQFEQKNGVPFGLYFEQIQNELKAHPRARIFIASDSMLVKEECQSEFGSRIVTMPHELSIEGNDHLKNKGAPVAAVIGENCLVDALILSRTDYFVHGTSNVSNFIACFNPALLDVNVYEDAFRKKGIDLRGIL